MFKCIKVIIVTISIIIITILTACITIHPVRHYVEFENDFCIKPNIGFTYLTCESVNVYLDDIEIIIPQSFDTDLASIPRWYWSILAPNNTKLVAPAILHDYLYSCSEYFDRKEADEILYTALLNNGVSNFTAMEMYIAVRWFGKFHYHPNLVCEVPSFVD